MSDHFGMLYLKALRQNISSTNLTSLDFHHFAASGYPFCNYTLSFEDLKQEKVFRSLFSVKLSK